ncbi:MAG: 16S rRNA (cytosine(1402)-N(4))-methyltransferase RsmH [Patescibacteria group bacterium]|nr:16S rRNA (cytosine(1402)-N(4))-methyltransferase RsmH [Patescibacteria group bacterium]MCL5262050.1 16S rRNA (cytosine(1402)-N(4))-methyltransferase RsmH [Patescibacteria group bacterium]
MDSTKNKNTEEQSDSRASTRTHIPVLLNETIDALDPQPGEFFVDGTAGEAGHMKVILSKIGPTGKYLAIDWNKLNAERLREEFKDDHRVRVENVNFAGIPELLRGEKADGLLLDLGFSSGELEAGRGFSFQKDEPLLMTYSDEEEPLYKVLKRLSEKEIFEILKLTGERYSRPMAKAIFEAERKHPVETTGELVEVLQKAVPGRYEAGRLNVGTRAFLGFRIYINRELENLNRILEATTDVVKPGGRVAVITFQSLEDKIVKEIFKKQAKEGKAELLFKKPLGPTLREIRENPRSRSAKLRAIRII